MERTGNFPDEADRAGQLRGLKQAPVDAFRLRAGVLQKREKIVRLLRAFSSPRKRLGLTPDDFLIFFASGYLTTRMVSGAIHVALIGMIDVSSLLGIPKEIVRRRHARLVNLDHVERRVRQGTQGLLPNAGACGRLKDGAAYSNRGLAQWFLASRWADGRRARHSTAIARAAMLRKSG